MRGKRRGLENVKGSLIRRNSPSRKLNDWNSHIPATTANIINVIISVLQQRKWISSQRAGKEGIFLGRGCLEAATANKKTEQITRTPPSRGPWPPLRTKTYSKPRWENLLSRLSVKIHCPGCKIFNLRQEQADSRPRRRLATHRLRCLGTFPDSKSYQREWVRFRGKEWGGTCIELIMIPRIQSMVFAAVLNPP